MNRLPPPPDGGELLLRTRDLGDDRVAIDVADTGPGLESELMSQLFKPLATRKKDGTGLGLWISRSMVERYGGGLSASNRDGPGACFTAELRLEPWGPDAAAHGPI